MGQTVLQSKSHFEVGAVQIVLHCFLGFRGPSMGGDTSNISVRTSSSTMSTSEGPGSVLDWVDSKSFLGLDFRIFD